MTDDSVMVHCPAGCGYGPKPIRSVAAHYSGSKDSDHQGGYDRAMAKIEQQSASEPVEASGTGHTGTESVPEPETDLSTQSDLDLQSETQSASKSNPVTDGPDPEPATGDDYPPEVREGCPKCGGELADFREVNTVDRGGIMYDAPDDYYCSECGTGFGWEDA